MSGIAGMVNPFEDISHQCSYICSISDSIRTRGPNGTGLFASPHLILAHRNGRERPKNDLQNITKVHYQEQDYVLISSGVIYNYQELRSQLETCGCIFSGNSFGELILYAYATWQEEALKKLNGMFVFALWLSRDKKLVLARDHLGSKPLYYAIIGQTLVFASEMKGILSHPHFKCSVGMEGLSELVCLSPRNSPGSAVIKGIHEVRPGHYVHYTPECLASHRYWKIEEKDHEDDLYRTAENIRELMMDSVNRHMTTDLPFCGLLSGGLYSSLITTIACEYMKTNHMGIYNTWSVDFERSSKLISAGPIEDVDTPWIRYMCRKAGTRHHYIILSSDDLLECLLEASEARGLPGMGDFDSSLMLLCREISKEYGVLLSGDCSDEILGGGFKAPDYSGSKKRFPWTNHLAEKISIFSPEIIDSIKPFEFIEKCYEEALNEYTKFSNAPRLGKNHEAEWFSLYWSLPFLLDRLDRMSMAFNLEARAPLCDHRLIEYLWNIPQELKNLNGIDRGLLRQSLKDILPPEILERTKNNYPRMLDQDYEIKIKNLLKDIVYDTGSPIRYLLEIKTLEAMMRQQDPIKRYTSRSQLYSWLIQLNFFLKHNKITLP